MIELLNSTASFLGYCAMGYGVLLVFEHRSKAESLKANEEQDRRNAESWHRFRESDPEGWKYADRHRQACKDRNKGRHEEIARLQREIARVEREMEVE